MSSIDERPDFSTIADLFLLHGSMQSPAFLDGRLCASLALHELSASGWLEEVCLGLGVEQPRDRESGEALLDWRRLTLETLADSSLNYEPLLPDELYSLAERAQGLREWTLGFLEVIEDAGGEAREVGLPRCARPSTTWRHWLPWRPISMTAPKMRTICLR
ncbi:hypothetical protein Q427_06640 [Halomonas sp. BC04]|nr:hypothetical protein Q427_06640 [Halomonas sp. BC04]